MLANGELRQSLGRMLQSCCTEVLGEIGNRWQHTQHEKARLQPELFRFSVLLSVRYAKSTERKRVAFNRIDYPLVMPRAKRASKGGSNRAIDADGEETVATRPPKPNPQFP
jgi:hypothetical protein